MIWCLSRSPGNPPPIPWDAIVAAARDAIIIVDDSRDILFFNAAAERMFDCPAADAVGTPLDRFVPLGAFPAPGAPGPVVAARRTDGTCFPVEVRPSETTAGGRRLVTVTARDLSERRRLDEAHARLAALIESSDDAIVAKDLDGIVTDWNPAAERIFGYTAEEMVGRSIVTLLPPDRRHEEDHILATLRRGGRIDHFDTIRRRKDGTLIYVSISVSPIKDAIGRVVGAAKIARDVSERKQSEAERETLSARRCSRGSGPHARRRRPPTARRTSSSRWCRTSSAPRSRRCSDGSACSARAS
jgi:PAS domain S-box-containing protein